MRLCQFTLFLMENLPARALCRPGRTRKQQNANFAQVRRPPDYLLKGAKCEFCCFGGGKDEKQAGPLGRVEAAGRKGLTAGERPPVRRITGAEIEGMEL